ncbi:hypothetical protein EGX47_04330 [Yersinia pseudotuberculosis]|uniref:Uncharacterized protein n=1 Tax=Yersinia pseudotuberculosis TaxID=633 RepID=A0ABN5R0W0_YERPU|nr:hypothetical protein [Yersinia pseudotuberculosis]AYW90628.1 hypothetical protein EGX47_04330 [Yersinia pseudotuberculosis]
MAICCRKNCKRTMLTIGKAYHLRLCHVHFTRKKELENKRELKRNLQCVVCNMSIAITRNEKYCSNKCKGIGLRSIEDDIMLAITRHSYWLNIERCIKSNPLQLNSINKLQDIADIYLLYKIKSKWQHSFNFFLGEKRTSIKFKNEHKLVPFMELELCHRYPNSKGGMNTDKNIIIGPAFINRMLKDIVPLQTKKGELNGEKGEGKIISVRTGLIKSLKCNFESVDIYELFNKIGNVPSFNGIDKRDVSFAELYNKNFIFDLLIEEVKRLKLMEVKEILVILKKMLFLSFNYYTSLVIIHPYHLDIVSLIFFHSILSGDKDSFIALSLKLFINGERNVLKKHLRRHHMMYYLLTAKKYVVANFGLHFDGSNDHDIAIVLYSKVFSIPPHYINKDGYPKWMINKY